MKRVSLQHHLSIAALLAFSYSGAFAQEKSASSEEALAEVLVTGSRLLRPVAESPTPLIQVDRDQLDLTGTANVADVLNKLPAMGTPAASPLTTNFNAVGIGLNLANLRNLGASRTLTLVNGRRHVAGSQGTSAVDLNVIPADFVESMEVITGGASAIYGSEAIAGVVNIITRKDFEGATLKARTGITSESDGQSYHLSGTYGTRFSQDKGHLMLHASYDDGGEIFSRDRRISSTDAFQNPNGSINSPARSGVTRNGTFTIPTISGTTVTVTQGADGLFNAPLTQDNRFDRVVHRMILLPVERHLLAGNMSYAISDSVNFSAEATYAGTKAQAQSEPVALGSSIWTLGRGGQSQDLLNLPVTNPFIPNEIRSILNPSVTRIAFQARPVNLGNRTHPADRTSTRIAAGLDGTVFGDWRWDTYVQYGRVKEDQETINLVNLQRFAEAIDAEIGPNGQPRCVSALARAAGCAPYNPFGQNSVSQAALDYVAAEALFESTITQKVAAFSLSGSPLSVPAGEVQLATGVEYREETSEFTVDPLSEGGLLSFGQVGNTIGDFDVMEVFAEASVPLISDWGPIESASIDAAVRFADYSSIGSTTSWKVGTTVELPGGFRLRGTYSEANRAPNIGELYLPQQASGGRVSDPCAGGGVTSGLSAEAAARRIANCAALSIGSSFVPDQLALESVQGIQGGNPNLQEETADTLTAGIVFAPPGVPGTSVSLDYWQIEITDAVGSISRQLTLNECVDQPTIDNQFCSNVRRHLTSRNILAVDSFIQNLANQNVAGVDLGANYQFGFGETHSLRLSLLVTRLLEDDLQQFTGSTVQDRIEEIGRPKWRGMGRVDYTRGALTLGWETQYIGTALKDKNVTSAFNAVDDITYSNVYLLYRFSDDIEANFGIENVFDEEAPLIASPHSLADISSQTAPGVYDPIGMRFYLGGTVRF